MNCGMTTFEANEELNHSDYIRHIRDFEMYATGVGNI